ncbi:MAG: 50S ribosomal protein L3 [Planctomycetota bacterium]|nr:50S ribosomal protein L3 [Planctomycetota bacterium]
MPATLIGRKIGMTRLYDAAGKNVPVTIIELGPCHVSQVKTTETDGYNAVQLSFDEIKARNSTRQLIGHDGKAGLTPRRSHREVRATPEEVAAVKLGQEVKLDIFDAIKFVDVIGQSKGKGFAGVMKRYHFGGLCASHGTERKHRSGGSIASHATNRGYSGRPKKGKKMHGHMGDERVTMRSLAIVARDKERNLLMVKGAVPGANQGLVIIREAVRLYKGKAELAKAS